MMKRERGISAERVQKYDGFVKEIHNLMSTFEGLTPKELGLLVKQHHLSSCTTKVLKDGGVIDKKGKFYVWVSQDPTIGTARELVIRLQEYQKAHNDKYAASKARLGAQVITSHDGEVVKKVVEFGKDSGRYIPIAETDLGKDMKKVTFTKGVDPVMQSPDDVSKQSVIDYPNPLADDKVASVPKTAAQHVAELYESRKRGSYKKKQPKVKSQVSILWGLFTYKTY